MSDNQSNSSSVPAPPDGDYVRYIPLGGLDEVGANCAIVECNGSMLMVDCGYTFPESESFGVDYLLPDWSYVLEHVDLLDGVVITHGHQDHIGALPYFLQEVDVPIYSGRLTLGLLRSQLEEKNLADQVSLVEVNTDELLEIGPFTAEFVHVNHSVPNARSISLDTPLGKFVVTGDWKLDQSVPYQPATDLQTFADLGRDGVTALFGDSTNAEVDGYSTSEADVKDGIEDVVNDAPGRVVVAQFSSNIHRLQGLLDLAHDHGRNVLLLGYSLRSSFDLGLEQGFIDLPDDDLMVKPHEARNLPDDELLVISTGSQAEPRASLSRLALDEHRHLTLDENDRIVISARVIPGNERGIQNMIDNLARRGVSIYRAGDAPIHGSGHGCAEELKLMMNVTDPDYLVPVHGHYAMRQRHAELGEEVGVPEQLMIENGDVLEFTRNDAEVVGQVDSGRVIVDGDSYGDEQHVAVRDRQKLANSGLIVAFAVIDRNTGDVTGNPDLIQHGLLSEDDMELMDRATDAARQGLEELSPQARRDSTEVDEALRSSIRHFFSTRIDHKPVVVPIVHEL